MINLLNEIIIRKDNIRTTSCAFVLIKNGMLMTFANRCIAAPTVALTCNTIKLAETIKNDPIILPVVSSVMRNRAPILDLLISLFLLVCYHLASTHIHQ